MCHGIQNRNSTLRTCLSSRRNCNGRQSNSCNNSTRGSLGGKLNFTVISRQVNMSHNERLSQTTQNGKRKQLYNTLRKITVKRLNKYLIYLLDTSITINLQKKPTILYDVVCE